MAVVLYVDLCGRKALHWVNEGWCHDEKEEEAAISLLLNGVLLPDSTCNIAHGKTWPCPSKFSCYIVFRLAACSPYVLPPRRAPYIVNLLFTNNPFHFFESLRQQGPSLRSLGYASGYDDTQEVPDLESSTGLSSFTALKEISVQACYRAFRSMLRSPILATPSLQRLSLTESDVSRFLDAERRGPNGEERTLDFVAIYDANPTLQTIDLISYRMPISAVRNTLVQSESVLKGKSVCLGMYRRGGTSCIPPVLHREDPYLDGNMDYFEDGEVRIFNGFRPEKLPSLADNCLEYR